MGKAKYQTKQHRDERAKWKPIVDSGQAQCAEPICLEERAGRGRTIVPGSVWHVCHTPDGLDYLGPGHERCNTSEGATRGNRARRGEVEGWWRL